MTRPYRTITTPFGKRFFFCLWLFGASGLADAAEHCPEWVAKLASVEGRVEMQRSGQLSWQAAPLNARLCPGDRLRTGGHSRAMLALRDETFLRLDQKTTLLFSVPEEETTSWLELFKGLVYFLSREPRRLEIQTPFVNAAIKGTEFLVKVTEARAEVSVLEGEVLAANRAGRLRLTEGQKAVAERGKAPIARLIVQPKDAVQWALYYPPLIDVRTVQAPRLQPALADYLKGDILGALDRLDRVPQQAQDAPYFTLKAALLMSVGRIDEARPALARALDLEPDNAAAYALESVIAVARSEKAKALRLAHRAVKLNPADPIPYIALSYAQQAHFAIEKALESLEKAVQLAPSNALAWARLSELALSRGNLDKSLKAAQRAAALEPDLARTQAVLGFAHLMQTQIEKAQIAFEKAIRRESAAPLPRLGLGLAKIRQGKLKAGREAIEIAATLDPANALIRSYLGKAYFEEKRGKLAQTEFNRAKELDPKDPTPWFYEAIYQQTINRPVEALHAMQKAIELNDNRAVYRSRLLLDQDLAARSAAIGRIYRDLGFEQRALLEGWKSVNTDPGNYSAHRLLADSYSRLPRHEIARVSELLQSQLLQPINITPIQPQLAESNLLILEGLGPAAPSFNEFNPLFARNRLALQASGIVGSNDTLGDEVVQSGLWNKFSYSLGQFHFETDGFRKNNDIRHDIYNVFIQGSLSYRASMQAEFRHKETEQGDPRLSIESKSFSPNLREESETMTWRVGYHYAPTPNSNFIASFIHIDRDVIQTDEGPFPINPSLDRTRRQNADNDANSIEGQYLWKTERINLIAGAGYYELERQVDEIQRFMPLPDHLQPQPDRQSFDVRNENVYLYSQFELPRNFQWMVGVSADFFEDTRTTTFDVDQVNPKLGLIWQLTPLTTLRIAGFRVLKRTEITNQTLEPTQVAGFNQFFDDFNGTDSTRYGIALDQKFSRSWYGGVELSARDLEVPKERKIGFGIGGIPIKREFFFEEWEEQLHRAYLYFTPTEHLALRAEYHFEKLKREVATVDEPTKLKTHRVPLGVDYFHPLGVFSRFQATYVDHQADFLDNEFSDDFWLFDVSLGYRLPNRLGILSLDVNNLFNQSFQFQSTDLVNNSRLPLFLPKRTVMFRFTLAF